MEVRRIDPAHIDNGVIGEAAAIIRGGGLVAFPTETVYGLGADATNAGAVAAIFAAKGRPGYNPLIVHAGSVTGARACVTAWPPAANRLAEKFWPGPLTIVLPKNSRIADNVTAGLKTVGVRVPSHPVALALLEAAGVPVAAPSANRSTQVSPTQGSHVADSLGATPGLILDAGPAAVGIESTVLDLTVEIPTILRPGMITRQMLAEVLGEVRVVSHAPGPDEARPSPGMMDRHYSPNAGLSVVDPSAVAGAAIELAARGRRVIVFVRRPLSGSFAARVMPESSADYARNLYGALREADAAGYQEIIVEAVPDDDAWAAVRDRLGRAARRS
jgi:L-threonylcarbamoyladenylate synthase